MITPDEEVRVAVLPREYEWTLTPEGEAALERARQAREILTRMTHGEPTEAEPTTAIPRAVADAARQLARQRRSAEIDGAPLS